MPAGATHQLAVADRRRPGVIGQLVSISLHDQSDMLVNKDPQAAEVYTLVIDNAVNDQVYGVDLTDPVSVDVNFTANSSATIAEIADGLAAAWNASPQARGIAEAVSDGTDTITFTGVFSGVALTIAEDEGASDMTLTNTTNAAEADPVPFGRAMISTEFQTDEPDRLGVIAKSTALTAQVDTLVILFATGEKYGIDIEIEGRTYGVMVDGDTNTATTVTAIVTALNLALPANSVIVTESGGTDVILTSELAGKSFLTKLSAEIDLQTNMALTNTTSGPSTDFNQVFAGISRWTYDEQQLSLTVEANEYAPSSGVNVLTEGAMWVENTETIVTRTQVFVELDGTGSDAGKFFNTDSGGTRVKVAGGLLRWLRSDGASSDADIASLRVHLDA